MTNGSLPEDLDWLPVAAALIEGDGTIVAGNSALARLLGFAPVAGEAASRIAPGLERQWRALTAGLAKEDGHAIEVEIDQRPVRITAALRSAGGGHRVLCVLSELAPRPAAVSGPARLESLGMVAGDLAHEFNNQLVGVIADASMLREEDALSEPAREGVLRIEAAGRRMSQLSRQLLAFAGRGRFVTMLLDPDALVTDARERLERLVRPGATLEMLIGGPPAAIEADRGLLRQVVVDLIENASEALPSEGGQIRVSSRSIVIGSAPHWELEIHDNGRGIEPAVLARIFDPFFSTKAEHRGLGLSAALGIVRRLGGDLEVESHEGQGATFRVRLPIVPGVVAPRHRTTGQQPPLEKLTGLRILVADDEPTVRSTVARMLERRAAIPVIAADGEEAEHLLRTMTFDAVLLDIMMPKKTGYQLVPVVRETQPGVPLILMSGYTDQAHGVEPPDSFLEKPFNASMLETAIQGALRNGNGNG